MILLAAVVALIFKTLDDDDDVDVRYNNATPSLDEELTDQDLLRLGKDLPVSIQWQNLRNVPVTNCEK